VYARGRSSRRCDGDDDRERRRPRDPEWQNGRAYEFDPRGFATFGLTALALLVFGIVRLRAGGLDRAVARLAALAALLLVVLYAGRLTVLDPEANVIKATALISGLIVNPRSSSCSPGRCCSRLRPAHQPPRSLTAETAALPTVAAEPELATAKRGPNVCWADRLA